MNEQIKQIAERLRGLRDVLELTAEDIARDDLAAADVAVLLLEHLSEKSHRKPPVTRVGRFNVVLSDFMMPRIARRKKCPAAQGRRRGMDVCL